MCKMEDLVFIYNNGIGNFVEAMPAIQVLSDYYNLYVCFDDCWIGSGRKAVEDICDNWDIIKGKYIYPRDEDVIALKKVFVFSHQVHTDGFNFFLEKFDGKINSIIWKDSRLHEIDYNLLCVQEFIGNKCVCPEVVFPIDSNFVLDSDNRKLVIANGALKNTNQDWERKCWPHFDQLISEVKDFSVFFIGGPDEYEEGERLHSEYGTNNLAGKLSILETASAIKQSDVFVTTDTGVFHIGDILKVNTIVLFGATIISKNGPYYGTTKILKSKKLCAPCQYHWMWTMCKRMGKQDCMSYISVEDVLGAIDGC